MPLPLLVRLSRLSAVPADLESVTERAPEAPETAAGLRAGSVEQLWSRIAALYRTGVQPGIQVCVRHQGQVVLHRAIGHARGNGPGEGRAGPVPMRTDTPINLFSAGKAVTAMLVHKLQERGHFGLDDPVALHLPGFGRHGKQAITVRQVLTHRAGLPSLPLLGRREALALLAEPQQLLEQLMALKPGRINAAPAYSAITGGFVLAALLRATTGRDPRALLTELIKQPLGARWLDFGLRPEQLGEVALNACTGLLPPPLSSHLGRVIGAPYALAVELSNTPEFLTALVPSGNLITTAADIAAFYQSLLDGGRWQGQALFAPETVRAALAPDRPGASLDRCIGIPIRYSPGFMVGHRGLGLYGWNRSGTFGHLGLSSTLTWARPDTGTVIAFLTNGKPVLGPHLPEFLALLAGFNRLCESRA
ncbi:MAG: serine hydrolase domain-containing protein [Stagnimonas sp.]|nr:serine hydrolase domain-containing protein [Stagnimonas sp.]